jgi:hypothetical protein
MYYIALSAKVKTWGIETMKIAIFFLATSALLVSACAAQQPQSESERLAALRADFDRANPGFASTYNTTPAPAPAPRGQVDMNAVMNGLMMMEAARPRPAPMPMPAPNFGTHCTTRFVGNTAYTDCN